MIGHTDVVYCAKYDAHDHVAFSGSRDTTIKMWDLDGGECKRTLYGHQGSVLALQFDREKVVSSSSDETIKVII